jgi:mono/diheme cytochrome c family protein
MNTGFKRFGLLVMVILISGCYRGKPSEDPPLHLNPNMDDQPRYDAQESSRFFENGAEMRQPVAGTVARGHLQEDVEYYYGRTADSLLVKKMPLILSMDLMQRGRERYNIFCSPCHDQTGSGQGIVIKKGFLPPPTFHQQRLREVEDGHLYEVIRNGIRNMPSYRHQISVADRWAIVAYVRAMQRSQNARLEDIPAQMRETIKK